MNAKLELLKELENKAQIKCALIWIDGSYSDSAKKKFLLPVSYTEDELKNFFSSLDFKYDNGYGGQELFGIVWLNDNTWLDRGEYDGSEWWQHQKLPEIPNELLK